MTITTSNPPSLTEVLKGKVYLGNLAAALSVEEKRRHAISHIVSVCPNYPSTGPQHLSIPVEDTEYDNLLIRFPDACAFIQDALDRGGRVLVHCVMGISRSSAVVAAFLMKTKNISPSAAISQLKQVRPEVHLNYGFIKQLDVFAQCNHAPSTCHPTYLAWKRRHRQDVTHYLNHIADTVSIVPDKLFLNSEFPANPVQAQSLLLDLGVTHLLTIGPAEVPPCASLVAQHQPITVDDSEEGILLALPRICAFISEAVKCGGLVLVHSMMESRACLAACAYLMSNQRHTIERSIEVIEEALPLFNSSRTFIRTLQSFEVSDCCSVARRHRRLSLTNVRDEMGSELLKVSSELHKTASSILNDTGLDMGSFGEALNSIRQSTSSSFIRVQ